jgi:hypothetical protein
MNVAEMLAVWEKSADRIQTWIDIEDLCEELRIQRDYWFPDMDDPLKKYWVKGYNWLCTDTMVGIAVYTLYGEIVGISFQSARKSDENFYWVSKESSQLVRGYLQSKMQEAQDDPSLIIYEQDVSAWETGIIDAPICRTDGRCQYAIDSGAEEEGHCPKGKCVMPEGDAITLFFK